MRVEAREREREGVASNGGKTGDSLDRGGDLVDTRFTPLPLLTGVSHCLSAPECGRYNTLQYAGLVWLGSNGYGAVAVIGRRSPSLVIIYVYTFDSIS